MEFTAKQILPPRDWTVFEDLCRALFAAVWGDPYTQKNGRTGQPQHGVDVWGTAKGAHPGTHCVQCKGKDANYHGKVTAAEFDAELAKAETFQPNPAYWILATTAPNDAVLQEHVRQRSAERKERGACPVRVLGWETLVALMGEHPKVIEQIYPEHGAHMQELLETVRALPRREDLLALFEARPATAKAPFAGGGDWRELKFDQSRGLGPALLGKPLGAADALQCPRLPEAADLVRTLDMSYSARLAGVPGAGKSVCALQAAESFASKGYRVVRLADPAIADIRLTDDEVPTVHLIDDAHLTSAHSLATAEQSASTSKLLLSTLTSLDAADTSPGMLHLDAKRAVRVIADDLRKRFAETGAAVRAVDDQVGDDLGEESLEWRLDDAARTEFPWQFCFVLSGGWRRVRSNVASARAAGADIVLGAVAIRQLASRDARTSRADLAPLLEAARIPVDATDRAIAWLVAQRLVLSADDLRCPHQRFSAYVFDPILVDQDKTGRLQIAAMMEHVLADPAMPLAGLATLLTEFRMSRGNHDWTRLIGRERLEPFLARCWGAQSPVDIAAALYALREMDAYIDDYNKRPAKGQAETIARWFSAPLRETAYAVGHYINATYRNRRFGRAIIRASNPEAIADALNEAMTPASADLASEIGHMVSQSFGALTPDWTNRYLARVDHAKALALATDWPADSSLYRAASFCTHFVYREEAFGLDCIESIAPAIAERMRADPVEAFRQLDDIFEASLRVLDPLGVFKGRRAATPRTRAIATQLCKAWEPQALAAKLSNVPVRGFQTAAMLLHVLRKSLPETYHATVAALDWNAIDMVIGDRWPKLPHGADKFLAQCHANMAGRAAVAQLIEAHVDEIGELDTLLAYLAPEAAFRQVERGVRVDLSDRWQLGAGVLVEFHKHRRALVPTLLSGHPAIMASNLSQLSATYVDDAVIFLRVCRQLVPDVFETILASVDVGAAAEEWPKALSGREARHRMRDGHARSVVAWLVHVARERSDPLGDLSRRLLTDFPKETHISARKLEPISGL